jgi:hypothetical protein
MTWDKDVQANNLNQGPEWVTACSALASQISSRHTGFAEQASRYPTPSTPDMLIPGGGIPPLARSISQRASWSSALVDRVSGLPYSISPWRQLTDLSAQPTDMFWFDRQRTGRAGFGEHVERPYAEPPQAAPTAEKSVTPSTGAQRQESVDVPRERPAEIATQDDASHSATRVTSIQKRIAESPAPAVTSRLGFISRKPLGLVARFVPARTLSFPSIPLSLRRPLSPVVQETKSGETPDVEVPPSELTHFSTISGSEITDTSVEESKPESEQAGVSGTKQTTQAQMSTMVPQVLKKVLEQLPLIRRPQIDRITHTREPRTSVSRTPTPIEAGQVTAGPPPLPGHEEAREVAHDVERSDVPIASFDSGEPLRAFESSPASEARPQAAEGGAYMVRGKALARAIDKKYQWLKAEARKLTTMPVQPFYGTKTARSPQKEAEGISEEMRGTPLAESIAGKYRSEEAITQPLSTDHPLTVQPPSKELSRSTREGREVDQPEDKPFATAIAGKYRSEEAITQPQSTDRPLIVQPPSKALSRSTPEGREVDQPEDKPFATVIAGKYQYRPQQVISRSRTGEPLPLIERFTEGRWHVMRSQLQSGLFGDLVDEQLPATPRIGIPSRTAHFAGAQGLAFVPQPGSVISAQTAEGIRSSQPFPTIPVHFAQHSPIVYRKELDATGTPLRTPSYDTPALTHQEGAYPPVELAVAAVADKPRIDMPLRHIALARADETVAAQDAAGASEAAESGASDPEALARGVYSIIMRRLKVERERRGY